MTDEEYKKIALKIYEEFFEGEENEQEDQNIEITNIGELFFGLFMESFSNIREEIPLCDYKNLIHASNSDKDVPNDEATNDILQPEYKYETFTILVEFAFKALKVAIDKLSGNEYVLHKLGIKDVEGFISKVNLVWNAPKSDERLFNKFNILRDLLYGSKNFGLTCSFILVSCLRVGQNFSMNKLRGCSFEEFVIRSKELKQCFDEYNFLCENRILYYKSLLSGIGNDNNRIKDFFDEYDLNDIFEIIIKCNSFKDFEANIDSYELTDNQKVIIIDALLAMYYSIYLNPKLYVTMTFFCLNNILPFQINEALLISLRSSRYAPLIQYEYEWWCNETGQTLNIPFPFSTEPFDKNNTTIVDYDLDKLKYTPNLLVNGPKPIKRIEYHEPDKAESGQTNKCNTIEQIIHDLNPYFTIFFESPNETRGSFFIAHYLNPIIALSETIKDSYNAYGFAYILFHSRYFNWNTVFNDTFVSNIMLVFGISVAESKSYPESKAKDRAKKILEDNVILRSILDDSTLKLFGW